MKSIKKYYIDDRELDGQLTGFIGSFLGSKQEGQPHERYPKVDDDVRVKALQDPTALLNESVMQALRGNDVNKVSIQFVRRRTL